MTTRLPYIFANWKMYLDLEESIALATHLADDGVALAEKAKLAIFPSALAWSGVTQSLEDTGIKVGAQNVHWLDKGGYTGEVSAAMYAAAGATYALVGHSERRHLCHETNHQVRQKIEAIIAAGLIPVVCVGETGVEREHAHTAEVIESQVRAALEGLKWPEGQELIVAYEPVWAIGSGASCDPTEASATHAMILKFVEGLLPGVAPVLLYGGSVREENISTYLHQEHIDGVIIGGASATLPSWQALVAQAVAGR